MSRTLFAGILAFLAKPETNNVFNVILAAADEALNAVPTTAENCVLSNGTKILSIEVSLKNDDRLVSKITFIYETPEIYKDWRLTGGHLGSDGFLGLSSAIIEPTPENGFARPVVKTSCGLDHRVALNAGLQSITIY